MADDKNSAPLASHGSPQNDVTGGGHGVLANVLSEKNDSEELPMAGDSNAPEGRDQIDYMQGTRFWLISAS